MRSLLRVQIPGSTIRRIKFGKTSDSVFVLSGQKATREFQIHSFSVNEGGESKMRVVTSRQPLNDFALSPDGSTIATHQGLELLLAPADRTPRAIEMIEMFEKVGSVGEMAWSPLDTIVAAYALDWPPVMLYHIATGQSTWLEPHVHEVSKHMPRLALSHDGLWLAFCHVFEHIFLFDLHNQACQGWPHPVDGQSSDHHSYAPKHTRFARRIWFSNNDRMLAVASYPRTKDQESEMELLIGPRDGTQATKLMLDANMAAIDLSPEFDLIIASLRGRPGCIGIWETDSGALLQDTQLEAAPYDMTFSSDGKRIAIAYEQAFEVFALNRR